MSLLGNIECSRRTEPTGAGFADFTPLPELGELQRAVYLGGGKKTISWEYLKALTPLALAIWFMDDGTFTVRSKGVQQRTAGGSGRVQFCIEALSAGSRDRLVEYLRDTHGLDVSWRTAGSAKKAVLTFSTASSRRFLELVAPYVHPSMAYKLLPELRGQFAVERAVRGTSRSAGPGTGARHPCASRRPDRCTGSTSRWKAITTTSSTV